jgi:hypothetical protein
LLKTCLALYNLLRAVAIKVRIKSQGVGKGRILPGKIWIPNSGGTFRMRYTLGALLIVA